ncbi:RagB/SusD family nutrient uptake outer membrane protein [Flavobacterium granuli]|uniref:Tetratricopeptide (TPR) repeat protein n=1 Tax=Flavobacterium granuli TaxID=280093 RepID=A0ABU1S3J6_9FLAO|nr:RagB/SusD family nutrient uptake outer membrane protein [Flavobacterium granuli]MDR6845602.1 tetratricopeptide (TPR) repeat protein [Flavobacterium granuli]
MINRLTIFKKLLHKSAKYLNNNSRFLIALCLTLGSCDSFVEVDLPASQLTTKTVFEDAGTAKAAMAGLYAKMRDGGILAGNSNGVSCNLGLYADEFDYYYQYSVSYFYTNSLFPGDLGVSDIWNRSYSQIYSANAVLEGLDISTAITEADKNQLQGEALFIRALLHFYLLNLYGDIPYINTTDYTQNSKVSRLSTEKVYNLIVMDLNKAIELLPEDYVSPERIIPNRSTANALLARVYLYMGLYPEASNAASAVLNDPQYIWETDLDKIFLKESSTTIWQFMPNTADSNTAEGSFYIFTSGPPPNVALKSDFVNAFEEGDQRKTHWITEVTDGTSTWYHASKYKQASTTPSSVEYSVVFRLAEQYLIRSEARAYQGDLIGAKEDLNLIRTTAGLSPTSAVTGEEIITDVLNQRRFELFTEFGQRFFDLKRTGKLDETLSASKAGWNTTDALWPLPALELNSNPNLNPQNPGY